MAMNMVRQTEAAFTHLEHSESESMQISGRNQDDDPDRCASGSRRIAWHQAAVREPQGRSTKTPRRAFTRYLISLVPMQNIQYIIYTHTYINTCAHTNLYMDMLMLMHLSK
jgi:hypothetical protein